MLLLFNGRIHGVFNLTLIKGREKKRAENKVAMPL
jgi:hypothetical protein